jgi:polysaccharide biosynthesis/export protein
MATMCRVIMAKNKVVFRHILALLIGGVLPVALMPVQGDAQAGMGIANPQQTLSSTNTASTLNKSGIASQGQGPVVVPKDFSDLRIEPGDLLSVNVYDSPELTNSYRVDPAGDLMIPLCGKVHVQGLTLTAAGQRLEAALRNEQILIQPQVNVDVLQYAGQYVTVLGEVVSPGRVAVIAPTSLGDIIAQSGGVTPLAGAHIKIRHGSNDSAPEEEIPYSRSRGTRESSSVVVRPGDSVIVPRAGIIYVLGAVARPGGYVMQEDGKLNVAQALALSGGTLMQAKTGGLRVIRRNPDNSVLDFPVSYEGIVKGTQTPLLLQAQDIVYVPMSKVKAAFSTAQGIIGSAASASIYAVTR